MAYASFKKVESSIVDAYDLLDNTEDQDLFVREGDMVFYGSHYYQIVKLMQPTQLFGQSDHKMEIAAKCIRAREGTFDAS